VRRINWAAASQAQAVYHDKYYYLAVPLDGAAYNNTILVYDLINKQWAGHWTSPVMDVAGFLRISVMGHRQLAFISGDSIEGNTGILYVMDEFYGDDSLSLEEDIETELLTRGYLCGVAIDKQFLSAATELATWNGAGLIKVIRDGVNEQSTVVSYAKDRTKYNLFAKRNYDTSNANNDFLDPFRQDYSIQLSGGGIFLGDGVVLGLHQYSSERIRIRQDSRYVQFRFLGTRGRNKVRGITLLAHADLMPVRSTI
jgi:hypothetical protein